MAFEELVKKISPTLKRITHKLNGRFTFFSEEDLYQEALLHLWLDFKEGKTLDKTNSYILQGCYFHLKNYLRKNYEKTSCISLEGLRKEDGEEFNLDSVISLEDPLPLREAVHCALFIEQVKNNGLTPREKEVFLLSLERLTTREIGRRLGVSHVAVVKLRKNVQRKCARHMD